MTRLRPLPFRIVARALARSGFVVVRQKGSHVMFRHSDGRSTIVPRHGKEDIGVGLLVKIARDVGVDAADLFGR